MSSDTITLTQGEVDEIINITDKSCETSRKMVSKIMENNGDINMANMVRDRDPRFLYHAKQASKSAVDPKDFMDNIKFSLGYDIVNDERLIFFIVKMQEILRSIYSEVNLPNKDTPQNQLLDYVISSLDNIVRFVNHGQNLDPYEMHLAKMTIVFCPELNEMVTDCLAYLNTIIEISD